MTGSVATRPRPAPLGLEPAEPVISVVVPTYNRPRELGVCLRALAAQTLGPGRYEVVVSDDGSSPPVKVVHAELLAAMSGTVRVVVQENTGPAAARNLGAAAARGRYLAFTDDDCEPAPDWLETLVARFEAMEGEVLLGGGMRNGLARNVYAVASHAIMDFVYEEQARRAGTRLFSTSNLSVPASGFREIGGFSPQFPDAAGEDYDLCWRWQETGRAAEYVPEAAIVHRHHLTLAGYLRQHLQYGRGLLRVRQRLSARRRSGLAPGPGFYLLLVLHPLRRWWEPGAWLRAGLIGASQAATAAGAALELVHPSRRRSGGSIVSATERT